MVSIPKIIGVISCSVVLSLSLSNAAQARMSPGPCADMNRGQPTLLKCDEESLRGIETIKGEVLRIKGQHFYVRRSDGKEMHLHTKPTTEMKRELKKGDRIEVQIDDQNNAVSIRQTQ